MRRPVVVIEHSVFWLLCLFDGVYNLVGSGGLRFGENRSILLGDYLELSAGFTNFTVESDDIDSAGDWTLLY